MTVAWDELVTTALLGTERRPFSADQLAPLAEVAVDGAEASILAGAAVVGAYRRAGRLPDSAYGRIVPPPAPDDPRPVCSDTAAQLLALLLDGTIRVAGGNEEVVTAWLDACERTGRRPPPRLLVTLLQAGTARLQLRPAMAGALGARGEWLAAANPDWQWAVPKVVTPASRAEAWATGTKAERVALLEPLRATDPATARELLSSTWPSEPAADRAAFLDALASTLTADDEPFLEAALDDRASSVRAGAAALLRRLPTSGLAQRMADRARPLVQREKRKLAVRLPEELDAAARRDGLTDTREAGKGVRAGWLEQIVSATPLTTWETHLDATPAEAVKLARHEPEVLAGWGRAAIDQRDARWAAALVDQGAASARPELMTALDPSDRDIRLEKLLRDRRAGEAEIVDALLHAPGRWTPRLTALVLERAREMTPVPASAAVQLLARSASPAVLPALEGWIARCSSDGLKRQLRELAHALSIRLTIDREFP